MAHITENRILETSAPALGASDLVPLEGAVLGFRTFASKCAAGDTLHYCIQAVDAVARPTGAWEIGRGTMVSDGGVLKLQRTQVVASSNADAAVVFAAGPKHVSLSPLAPSAEAVRLDQLAAMTLDLSGMVAYFARNTPPPGWLKANGAAISRTTYARLFERIGTTFGAGNGSTTFNLPDARGEFLRGWDDARGVDASRAFGSWQDSANRSHAHSVYDPGHAHSIHDPTHAHGAWTDQQGWHAHVFMMGENNSGYGLVAGGGFVSEVGIQRNGKATEGAGTHGHNVGVGGSGTGISIYGAYTGISIYADGLAEARARNLALLCCIRY